MAVSLRNFKNPERSSRTEAPKLLMSTLRGSFVERKGSTRRAILMLTSSNDGILGLMRVFMPAWGGITFSRNIISDLMSPVTPAAYSSW
jgi:hypothetical protein